MEESVLIAFLSASVLLTLSPGPDILYVFSLSLSAKKKDAIKLTWGLTTGLFLHTAVVAMVFFPGFVFSGTLSLQTQFGVLGLLFWGQAFLIFNGVALLGDRIQKYSYFSLTQRFQNRLQAFVLLCIAVVLLMSA